MDAMLGRIIQKLDQLPKQFLGIIFDLLVKLTGTDAGMWIFNLKKFLRQEQCWIPGAMSTLFKRIKENIVITLDTGTFVASKYFVIDTSLKASVRISYLGDNFRQWMLDKQEQPPASAHLCCYELLKASVNEPIINELGGEQKAETTLPEIYALMKRQRNGEEGALLTNGNANIFYVCDVKGVLRTVDVSWGGGVWRLSAFPVEGPLRWLAGDRVFSRNSL